MKKTNAVLLFSFVLTLFLSYSNAVIAASHKQEMQKASATIAAFKKKDPSIKGFFNRSYGYAVFPTVGKGGIGIGGAFGKGKVFRGGKYVGNAKLTQVSVGFQLGGQAYSEIIFFQTKSAFRKFTDSNLKLSAQVSAVAITEGAGARTAFKRGIAIFTMAKGGLMYEATVAGQQFKYSGKR